MKKIYLFITVFRLRRIILPFLIILITCNSVFSQDTFLNILGEELEREMNILQKEETPPYYMCYRVDEKLKYYVKSSFGIITSSNNTNKRLLTVMVRVGSHELDNFHELRENRDFSFRSSAGIELPLGNEPKAVKQALWKATNEEYRKSMDKYAKVKANVAVKVEEEDLSADFTKEKAYTYYEPPLNDDMKRFDKTWWEERLKNYSYFFLDDPAIFQGTADITFEAERKYFISTEGTKISQNRVFARISISGRIKSEDGMVLPLYKSYFAYDINDLPDDETIMNDVKKMVETLKRLKDSPLVDPYSGPALMSGEAAGVFFHEIFGHRIEGQRLKSERDAQTFKKKVGEEVLPKHLNIYMDPTISEYKGKDVNGYFKYDDQGIEGKRVVIIGDGILKGFVMSRCPIEGFNSSNGHGRAQTGKQPVARQSNLIIETSKPYTEDKLKKMLIEEAKKQGLEYAYYFQDVTGGFTFTGRFIPNAFNVTPTKVYRIYTDGRPDELVRGVDLVGTPLSIFSEIEAAGDEHMIFNGFCGAESGRVPVSCVSPTLFVKKIELQKKYKSQERPPLLPRPDIEKVH